MLRERNLREASDSIARPRSGLLLSRPLELDLSLLLSSFSRTRDLLRERRTLFSPSSARLLDLTTVRPRCAGTSTPISFNSLAVNFVFPALFMAEMTETSTLPSTLHALPGVRLTLMSFFLRDDDLFTRGSFSNVSSLSGRVFGALAIDLGPTNDNSE